MAATRVNFVPSITTPFQFSPILNGVQYNALVQWNIFSGRYFLNLTDLAGDPVTFVAIPSSGPRIQMQVTWAENVATVVCVTPHIVPLAEVASAYISTGGTPFDGLQQLLATGPTTLTYSLAANPNEPIPVPGSVAFAVNLVAGLNIGWLLYWYDIQQFEFQATP